VHTASAKYHRRILHRRALAGRASTDTTTLPIPEAFIPPTLNLDIYGKPLTYRYAKNGPDRLNWERAEAEELIRLLDSETIVPSLFSSPISLSIASRT
jgi:hypothetical protein